MNQQIAPAKIEIQKVGSAGVIQDIPFHEMPSQIWSSSNNFRFRNGVAQRFEGHQQALGTPTVAPYAVFNVPGIADDTYWIYFSLTKAYVANSGIHTNITRAAGDYTTVNGRSWGACFLAGTPIFNNELDVPQYWSALNPATPLAALPNWNGNKRCKVMRAFGPYLIAMNMTETGTNKPHKVLTSSKADPGSVPTSWDDTDPTVDTTSFELTDVKGGEILDGVALGSQFVIYKKNSTHIMRFSGGNDIWTKDRLFENSGILFTRCACAFKEGTLHFVVTQNDIIVHSGSPGSSNSVVEGKNRQAIFNELDSTNYFNSFVFDNKKKSECWFCYPTTGQTYPNKAFVYNYANGTSGFRDIPSALGADFGVVTDTSTDSWAATADSWDSNVTDTWDGAGREAILLAVPGDTKLYALDSGYAFGSLTPLAFLERQDLVYESDHVEFGQRILITRIWPKITGTGSWSIRVGASEYEGGTITWSDIASFDPTLGVPYIDIDPPVNGRLPAVRFEYQNNLAAAIQGYDLRVAVLGEF